MYIDALSNPVLHPWHKLSYFKQAGWPADWINTAKDIVHAQFKCSYVIKNDNEDEQEVGDGGDIVMVRQSKFFILF